MLQHVNYPFTFSHLRTACANVHAHVDIFSGMYTSLGTCDIPLRILGSWEKMQVYKHKLMGMSASGAAC